MNMAYEENKKSFLEELQALDESTKRKVVVVATIVIMIGVVYLWSGYFNGLVAANGAPANEPAATSAGANWLSGAMQGIGQWFKNPGQYTIHPQSSQ
jgi:hypothetical protein